MNILATRGETGLLGSHMIAVPEEEDLVPASADEGL